MVYDAKNKSSHLKGYIMVYSLISLNWGWMLGFGLGEDSTAIKNVHPRKWFMTYINGYSHGKPYIYI